MVKRKQCTFQDSWLSDTDFSSWLKRVEKNDHAAYCIICKSSFSLSNMGKSALVVHSKGQKHQDFTKASKNELAAYFTADNKTNQAENIKQNELVEVRNDDMSVVIPKTVQTTKLDKLTHYRMKEEVTKAEILLCLEAVMRHKSLRDIEEDLSIMKTAFPDSAILSDVKLSKSKASYIIVYGLPTCFQNELNALLEHTDHIVIGFDESLNKVSGKNQMDIGVRFWNIEKSEVSARYLTSAFLNKADAVHLLEAFKKSVPPTLLCKILQISMDGPNVNLKFHRDLQADLNATLTDTTLLGLGTCGLHTLHGAIKTGLTSADWNIIPFLRALYNLFKDVPARRGDYTAASGSDKFPKKFCAIRWLENVPVIKTAREILPHVQTYVSKVVQNGKVPRCNSFQTVSDTLKDKFLDAKLAFFESLAGRVEPFLREFQSDYPLVPFLYDTLQLLIHDEMARFVKSDILSAKSISSIDLDKQDNLLTAKQTDIGFATKAALRDIKSVTALEICQFKEQCRQCLKSFVKKLMDRSPLKFSIVKGISCFNPATALETQLASERLEIALKKFVEARQITGVQADQVATEYKRLLRLGSTMQAFKDFRRNTTRLDHFWLSLIDSHGSENYSCLLAFIKKVMILSHGNSALERGFSINKECIVENQTERSLIAQRLIYDGVLVRGGLKNFIVTKPFIHAARNSASWYSEALAANKKSQEEAHKSAAEKKSQAKILKELKGEREKLMSDALKRAAQLDEKIENLKR